MKDWRRYIRQYPPWVYEFHDAPIRWYYRFWYCRRHGHQIKFGMRDRCAYCGKRVGQRT